MYCIIYETNINFDDDNINEFALNTHTQTLNNFQLMKEF